MKQKWNPEFEDSGKYERVTGPIGRDEEGNQVRKLSLLDGRYVLNPPLEQDKRDKDNQIVYPPPIGRVNILEANTWHSTGGWNHRSSDAGRPGFILPGEKESEQKLGSRPGRTNRAMENGVKIADQDIFQARTH